VHTDAVDKKARVEKERALGAIIQQLEEEVNRGCVLLLKKESPLVKQMADCED